MRLLDRLPASMHYSLRYLKARLRILKRPAVWGSTAVMLVILVGFAEYWRQSEEGDSAAQRHGGVASLDDLAVPTPSEADSAIGADIDTLPLLLDEFDFGKTPIPSPPVAVSPAATDRPATVTPLATPPVRSTQRSASTPSSNEFFNLELPRVDLLSGVTSLFPSTQPAETGTTDRPTTPTTSSPLQSAIQRYGTPSLERSPVNPSPRDASSPSPISPGTPVTAPLPLPVGSAQPVVPVAPPVGTPSYTLPPSLRSAPLNSAQPSQPSRSYVDSFTTQPIQIAPQLVPPSAPLPLQPAGQSPNPTYEAPQGSGTISPNYSIAPPPTVTLPQPVPASPFSVPNRVPGRYIGNGEFNTFSNP